MPKYSKRIINKLNLQFAKLQEAHELSKFNYQYRDINLYHKGVLRKNKALITGLLLELMFIKIRIREIENENNPLINKVLLKNKKIFINEALYPKSYLDKDSQVFKTLKSVRKLMYFKGKILKSLTEEKLNQLKIAIKKAYRNDPTSNKQLLFVRNLLFTAYEKITSYENFLWHLITKWYIYVARFILVSTLNFIPFIQLTSSLFYNQPSRLIIHPITSYLLNFAPWLLPLLRRAMPLCNQDNFAFLILVPYFYFFIYSRKRYKISSKVGYQGTFALALMLFRYSVQLLLEVIIYSYRFTKRFFFLTKSENLNLLGDDLDFFLEDLEELREEREYFLHLGESLFSLKDATIITKIYETTTVFAFIGVIALLYNYVYFICRGRKPIIPVVTRTVRRMMIDRNGTES